MSAPRSPRSSIERQLLSNQIWESVAFLAKAAFMLGLTPWMLRVWGSSGYGEFALASSAFVLLSILDFGIRGHTRLELCRHHGHSGERAAILGHSIFTFSLVAAGAIAVASILTATGALDRLFNISPGQHYLLLITTVMTMLVLASGLMLEPLIAAGEIGRVKLATAVGWLLAIPAAALVLWSGGGITLAVVGWLGCLFAANILAAVTSGGVPFRSLARRDSLRAESIVRILREGLWFNATNTTWLTRTYGATLLISALDGPVAAGAFFILLRLSEIISALGAISSDVSLGELAQARTSEDQRRSFRSTYSWAGLLCLHAAIVIGFLTPDFFQLWLRPATPPSPLLGIVVVALGLGSALNRTATYAALGLGIGRTAAKWGAVETVAFISVLVIFSGWDSLLYRLALASLAAFALIPIAVAVSRQLRSGTVETWLQPVRSLLPSAAASVAVLAVATFVAQPWAKLVAAAACGGIALFHVFALSRKQPLSSAADPAPVTSQIAC